MVLSQWFAYVTVCLLFSATPGPSVVLAINQGISRGFASGLSVIAGTQLGNSIYFSISAAGLGVILTSSETALHYAKIAGAAYLVLIGIWTVKDARKVSYSSGAALSVWQFPFNQGLLNQLSNPKSILFFGAMFPQFINYSAPDVLVQYIILACTILFIDSIVLLFYVLVACKGHGRIGGGRSACLRELFSGAVLIGLGGALGFDWI